MKQSAKMLIDDNKNRNGGWKVALSTSLGLGPTTEAGIVPAMFYSTQSFFPSPPKPPTRKVASILGSGGHRTNFSSFQVYSLPISFLHPLRG